MKYNEQYVLGNLKGKSVLVLKTEEKIDATKVITINEIGVVIVRGLQKGKQKEDIVSSILAEYDVARETVEKDYDEFVAKLLEIGVVIDA